MAGAGDFLYFELPFLRFAEASGHPLGYATDLDLHADPHLLEGARAMITPNSPYQRNVTPHRFRANQQPRNVRAAQ